MTQHYIIMPFRVHSEWHDNFINPDHETAYNKTEIIKS